MNGNLADTDLTPGLEGATTAWSDITDQYNQYMQTAVPTQVGQTPSIPNAGTFGEQSRDAFIGAALVPFDFANTVASSVGLVDENFLQNKLKEVSPQVFNTYMDNKDGIQLVGGVIGAMIPGTLAVKAIQVPGKIGSVLKMVPMAEKMMVNANRAAALDRLMRTTALRGAMAGMGGDALISNSSIQLAGKITPITFKQLQTARRADAFFNGVKEAVASEAAIYATMNTNDALYGDDMSMTDYVLFNGAGALVGVGLNMLVANKQINRALRASAQTHHIALGEDVASLQNTIVRPGNEDVAITEQMLNWQFTESVRANPPQGIDAVRYQENLNKAGLAANARVAGGAEGTKKGLLATVASRGVFKEVAPSFQLSTDQNAHLVKALEHDPTAFLGVKELRNYSSDPLLKATLNTEKADLVTRLDGEIQSLQESLAAKTGKNNAALKVTGQRRIQMSKKLDELQTQRHIWNNEMQPFVLRNGAWQPVEDHVLHFTDDAINRSFVEYETAAGIKGAKLENVIDPITKRKFSLAVDYDLNFSGLKGETLKGITRKSPYEHSALFALYDQVIDNLGKRKAASKVDPIRISMQDDWRRLDAIDEALRTKSNGGRGTLLESDVLFPAGVDLKQMRQVVVAKKYKEYLELMDRMEVPSASSVHKALAKPGNGITPASIRYALNLPEGKFGDISPLEGFFAAARAQGAKNIDNLSLDQIVDQALKFQYLPQGMEFMAQDLAKMQANDFGTVLRGTSFAPAKTTQGYMKPVIGWRLNMDARDFTRTAIDEQNMLRRAEVTNDMLSPYYDPNLGVIPPQASFSSRLTNAIMNSSAYADALNVNGLNQASLRTGLFGGRFVTQQFIARDDPTLLAVNAINSLVDRETNTFTQALYKGQNTVAGVDHSTVWARLRNKDNEGDLFQFQEYVRARHNGWYLKSDIKDNADGTFSFILDDNNAYNNQKFRALFGRDLQKGDAMPRVVTDRQYRPMTLSKNAYHAAESFRQIGPTILAEQNRLRKAMGLSPIQYKEWWVPNRKFNDKHVLWVVSNDGSDKIVNAVTADTAAELEGKKSSRELQEFLANNNAVAYTQGEIEQYMGTQRFLEARDRAVFDILDANDMLVKGGNASKGSSVDPFPSSGIEVLDEAVQTINKQMQNIARDTVALAFESQIGYAGRMSKIDTTQGRNVWGYYKDMLLGNRALYNDRFVGKGYMLLESSMDRSLDMLWDATNGKGLWGQTKELGKSILKGVGGPDLNANRFNKLKKELGEWLPYQNTQEFVQSRFNVKPPTTSKELMAGLNYITSTVMLRFLDLSQPLMNFTGLAATMPAVIQAMKRTGTETDAEWRARIGAFSSVVDSQSGPVPYLNTARLFTSAVAKSFSKSGKLDWEYAKANGFLRQQVAEIHEVLEAPLRDEKSIGTFVHKYAEKASWAADKSEETSRGIAHMAGLLLAGQHGIKDIRHRHSFANRFANEVIGDYRSINKPTVFQGTVGMPLGLFQTYAWNYYQRVFGYLENKQYKAAATQFGMQAALFGAVTVPGYSLFNSMWNNALHGEKTPVDSLQAAYPPAVADLLLYGTVSNIPKIFGLDGMALYSRGDANPRIPTFIDPSQAPIYSLATSVGDLLGGMVDQVRTGGDVSAYKTMELLGTYVNNRTLARLFEVASGYSIDRRGNVINADTQSATRVISSVLGLRTLNEAKNSEVMQRQQASELAQYELRTRMSAAIKTAMRHGDMNEGLIRDAISNYALSGGSPEYFPRYLKQLMLNATTDRAQVKLLQFLKSDEKILDAMRLMNAGVRFDPDEAQIEQME